MPARPRTIGARGAAAAALTALAVGTASGCGPSDQARGLTSAERVSLQRKLSEVRRAVQGSDPSGAETALDEFVDEVGALQARGALDAETASGLLTGAARARRQVAVEVEPPAPPPAPPQPTRSQPEEEPEPKAEKRQAGDDGEDQGKGKKARGNKKDDGEGD